MPTKETYDRSKAEPEEFTHGRQLYQNVGNTMAAMSLQSRLQFWRTTGSKRTEFLVGTSRRHCKQARVMFLPLREPAISWNSDQNASPPERVEDYRRS